MAKRFQDYTPLGLREKLDEEVYECTLFREEEDEDPEGELFKDGDAEPFVVYGFWFKPFKGDEISLTASEFDVLCSLDGFGVDLADLKGREQLHGSMGAKVLSSLEAKLIPQGMASVENGNPDAYTLSELASTGEYFAEEKIAGGEKEE